MVQVETEVTDKQSVVQTLDMYRASLSSVRFSGLEKTAQYWTLSQRTDGRKQPVGDPYYTYYAVWAMDRDLFGSQLDTAIRNIDETTTEAKELKAIVRQKLSQELSVSSNDDAIRAESDDYISASR